MPQDCEKNRLVRFDLAQETVRDALEWDGSRPYGPATTLRQYIRQLAWHLSIDGWITGPDYLKFNILHDSCGRICTLAKVMWSHPIISLVDRKGFGDFVPDLAVFHRVFHGLTEEAQHLVKLNIVGAFQTVARKAKWDESITDECELCGQTDTREHRLLHCHLLQDVRQNAQEACSVLQNERAAWIYLPMPRVHDQLTVFRAFVRSRETLQKYRLQGTVIWLSWGFLLMVLPSTEGTVVPELQLRRLCKISLLILNKSGKPLTFCPYSLRSFPNSMSLQ